jgi:SagB-type dehydrogenase family enzyme
MCITGTPAVVDQEGNGISFTPSTLQRFMQDWPGRRRYWPAESSSRKPPPLRKEIRVAGSAISLPQPASHLPKLFSDVLAQRRSVRRYADRPLDLEEISTFLYHTARVIDVFHHSELGDTALRPFPTAGARSELELYLVNENIAGLDAGAYYYNPFDHSVLKLSDRDDHQGKILAAANVMTGEQLNRNPAAAVLITAVFDRTMWKYGDLGPSLIYRDAGCLIQTCYLVATALDIAPCALGGELDCSRWLQLDPKNESQVGCVLLGPATEHSDCRII